MSERDGWNHLYLYDGVTGRVKNQITKGEWVVRGVDSVDVAKRQIYFRASGMNADQDPYFIHYYRINFDGTGLVAYTEADGTHAITWSPDRQYYIDTYSRVDMPTVVELRRVERSRACSPLEKGDMSAAVAAGFRRPRSSSRRAATARRTSGASSSGRSHFDPNKKYPVIEQIYAGPQGSFVPKTWGGGQNLHRDRGTRLRARADRRHGHEQSLEGVPRCRVEEPRATPASPIASSGTRRSNTKYPWYDVYARRHVRQARPAGRTRRARCSSTATSTMSRSPTRAATTTAWTRSGGTSSGWVRSGPHYEANSNVDARAESQGPPLSSRSASWTPTSIPSSDDAGRRCTDPRRQGLRSARGAERRPRRDRPGRHAQAQRLLRALAATA